MNYTEKAHEIYTWNDYTVDDAVDQNLNQAEYVEALMREYDGPHKASVAYALAIIVAREWPIG
jgi:hypothetical protein